VLESTARGEQTSRVDEVVLDLRDSSRSASKASVWFDQDLTTEELAETVMAINAALRAS